MADSNIDMMRQKPSTPLATAGLAREVPATDVRVGRNTMLGTMVYDRLRKYDWREAARQPQVVTAVALADRDSMEVACEKLHAIHRAYGIEDQLESFIAAFDFALLFFFGTQGFSVLTPMDSAIITVGGSEFNLHRASQLMGTVPRRFGRGVADMVVEVHRRVFREGNDPDATLEQLERSVQLQQLATRRGARRMPWLASEVAAYALQLSQVELDFALDVETRSLEGTTNVADTRDKSRILFTKDERSPDNGVQYTT